MGARFFEGLDLKVQMAEPTSLRQGSGWQAGLEPRSERNAALASTFAPAGLRGTSAFFVESLRWLAVRYPLGRAPLAAEAFGVGGSSHVTEVTKELTASNDVGLVVFDLKVENGGADGTRTRDLSRDRRAF